MIATICRSPRNETISDTSCCVYTPFAFPLISNGWRSCIPLRTFQFPSPSGQENRHIFGSGYPKIGVGVVGHRGVGGITGNDAGQGVPTAFTTYSFYLEGIPRKGPL